MAHFRKAHFHPRLLDRTRYEAWKEAGAEDLYERCNAEAKKLLSDHVVKPKPGAVLGEIEDILDPPRKIMSG
jgi:trimethylamine:corrinoid methyltransferase-like protein